MLRIVAAASGNLKDPQIANKVLNKIILYSESIDDVKYISERGEILQGVAIAYKNLNEWQKLRDLVQKCPTIECNVNSLTYTLTLWAEKHNPALQKIEVESH